MRGSATKLLAIDPRAGTARRWVGRIKGAKVQIPDGETLHSCWDALNDFRKQGVPATSEPNEVA